MVACGALEGHLESYWRQLESYDKCTLVAWLHYWQTRELETLTVVQTGFARAAAKTLFPSYDMVKKTN